MFTLENRLESLSRRNVVRGRSVAASFSAPVRRIARKLVALNRLWLQGFSNNIRDEGSAPDSAATSPRNSGDGPGFRLLLGAFSSCARVVLPVLLAGLILADMGGTLTVDSWECPEEFLEGAQVGAAFEQMSGKAVAQLVWRLAGDVARQGPPLDALPEGCFSQRVSPVVQEHAVGVDSPTGLPAFALLRLLRNERGRPLSR